MSIFSLKNRRRSDRPNRVQAAVNEVKNQQLAMSMGTDFLPMTQDQLDSLRAFLAQQDFTPKRG